MCGLREQIRVSMIPLTGLVEIFSNSAALALAEDGLWPGRMMIDAICSDVHRVRRGAPADPLV